MHIIWVFNIEFASNINILNLIFIQKELNNIKLKKYKLTQFNIKNKIKQILKKKIMY